MKQLYDMIGLNYDDVLSDDDDQQNQERNKEDDRIEYELKERIKRIQQSKTFEEDKEIEMPQINR